MSKLSRSMLAAALSVMGLTAAASQSQAAIFYMNISDSHPPVGGVAGFNGANVVSLGGIDDFVMTDGVTPAMTFPLAQFNITSGFAVGTTLIADTNSSTFADNGDTITANIGPGTFDIVSPLGILVHGSFANASLNTFVGSTAVTINSANVNGLDLVPGPVLTGLGIVDFLPSESFALNIVGIAGPGVQLAGAAPVFPGLFLGSMAPFAIGQAPSTSGSVNLVADLVVPEPASLGMLSVGALGLLARRRRA